MLDLGPAWLDKYVREVLTEALANGLEYGIVNGTGKDQPIGMTRQVGDGVTVVSGEYPEKEPIKITAMNMIQLGNITSIMARNSKGQARVVSNLIMLVNPVDYWKRVLPATRAMTPDGTYVSTMPIPVEIIQSAAVKEGTVTYGMGDKYFLGVGMAKMEKSNILTSTGSWKTKEYILSKHTLTDSPWIIMLLSFSILKTCSRFVSR